MTEGQPAATGLAPTSPKVVPVRHWGQWVGAVVVIGLVVLLIRAIASNEVIQWGIIGERLTASAILDGLGITIWLTIASMLLGLVGGVVLAVMRLSTNALLRTMSGAYIWLFRGTPVLVQILLWFNLALFFPTIGFGDFSLNTNDLITPFGAALLALALNESAYMAEIVRAGIQSVDSGQVEAAEALGMEKTLVMRRIVLPQAMRVIIPPTGNELVTLLKTTSLVAVIGAGDLLTKAQAIGAVDFTRMEMLIVASVWYIVLTSIFTYGQMLLERRFQRGHNTGNDRRTLTSRLAANLRPGRVTTPKVNR